MALLVVASIYAIRQFAASQTKHVEMREAFILLHTKGYTNEAQRLYRNLLRDIQYLSNKELILDFQRTLLLVDPSAQLPDNLIWIYHWTISNELERRSESTLMRALKLAEEIK